MANRFHDLPPTPLELLQAGAPACKTQDALILKAAKSYEESKKDHIIKGESKAACICDFIERHLNDVYNPSKLPGYHNRFALFREYCRLWDKVSHSDYWCDEYIDFLEQNPERFWYCLYAYALGSEQTRKRPGNTQNYTGREIVTVINAIGVEEYFGIEMLYVNGNEFYPDETLVTYFVRYVNAYSGSWQGKRGFESITEEPDPFLVGFGIQIDSRPRRKNHAVCPNCGCLFNHATGKVIEAGDHPGSLKDKRKQASKEIEKAALERAKTLKDKLEKNRKINLDNKIKRAERAAKRIGFELSTSLDPERVENAFSTLIGAAEIEKKARTVKILQLDMETLLWYIETFSPSND